MTQALQRLFSPHPACPGVLRCAICGEVFTTAQQERAAWAAATSHQQTLVSPSFKNGSRARRERLAHGQQHASAGEARIVAGVFYLPPERKWTAADHGFTNESNRIEKQGAA